MARKILVVYLVYTVIVFLAYTYIFKENYNNALLKSIISGVIFTAIYAFLAMRNEKRTLETENKKGDLKKTSPRKK